MSDKIIKAESEIVDETASTNMVPTKSRAFKRPGDPFCCISNHSDCPVIVEDGDGPFLCLCDCRDCMRAWFADDQPTVIKNEVKRRRYI